MSVLLTFFIVMPIMGALYVDLDALRTSLQVEIKRVEKLRKQLQQEIQQQRSE
jgi:hypothetical protein